MASELGFDEVVRRLDRIGAWVRPDRDGLLHFMAAVGRGTVGVGLGMIVDGVLIMGAIGPERRFSEALREAANDAMDGANLTEEVREILEAGWESMARDTETQKADDDELMNRYEPDVKIDDVDLDDVYRMYRMVREDILDLHDVQMYVPPANEPIQISAMRVHLSKIGAWWPLKAQGVTVNYNTAVIE